MSLYLTPATVKVASRTSETSETPETLRNLRNPRNLHLPPSPPGFQTLQYLIRDYLVPNSRKNGLRIIHFSDYLEGMAPDPSETPEPAKRPKPPKPSETSETPETSKRPGGSEAYNI